jgi:uncharacterized protein YjiS (DUF1127 family)
MSTQDRSAIVASDFHVARFRTLAAAMLTWVVECRERAAQRRRLALLDDRLLRDIGLSRTDVAAECGKWFWLT